MGSSVTKAKCALERFFIHCPAPPFMNVAIPEKCSEGIYTYSLVNATLGSGKK